MQFIQNSIWLILNIMSFFTNLPITEIAILIKHTTEIRGLFGIGKVVEKGQ